MEKEDIIIIYYYHYYYYLFVIIFIYFLLWDVEGVPTVLRGPITNEHMLYRQVAEVEEGAEPKSAVQGTCEMEYYGSVSVIIIHRCDYYSQGRSSRRVEASR